MDSTTSRSLRPAVAWIAIITVGLAALQMGLAVFGGFLRLAIVAAPALAIVSMTVAWFALRWQGETTAARVCLLGSLVGSIIALLASSVFVHWLGGSNVVFERSLLGTTSTSLSGALLGAPPGLVFGALFVLPIRRVHRLSRERAVEAVDRTLRVCGVWLFVVSVVCLAILALLGTAQESLQWFVRAGFTGSAIVTALAGAVALVAHFRITQRRRWFERVQSGHEAGWTIVPRSFVAEEVNDLQTLFVSGVHHNVVLVRTECFTTGGAYRRASNLVPFALVHLPEGLAAMSFSLPDEEHRPEEIFLQGDGAA